MKEKYRELCKSEPTIPLFSKDWWLDAVCGEENWDVAIYEENNKIVASLPYYKNKKFFLRYCTMPMLTQTMGVWIEQDERKKYYQKLSYEKRAINKLLDLLPAVDMYSQSVHYSLTNWLPFYWRGFTQTTRYTYVIEDLADVELVYSNFTKEKRAEIKKAANIINVYTDNDIDKFYKLNELVFKRQNIDIPYSLEFLKRVDKACAAHESRIILVGEDDKQQIHSMVYIVWDEYSAYLLMSGTDPALKSSNAKSLLVWEAIQLISRMGKKFDFEGSMMESVESFFRSFGAVQKPYFCISKENKKWAMFKTIRSLIKS